MENQINDTEILALVDLIDQYIMNMIQETQLAIPTIASIFLARLMLVNDYHGSGEVFRDMMRRAIDLHYSEYPPKQAH